MATVQQPVKKEWKHDLFSCCSSTKDCCCAYCCPCCYAYTASKKAEQSTVRNILQCLCYPLGLCFLRPIVREKQNIDGNFAKDCLAVYFCSCCAVIQIKREFDNNNE